MSEQRLQDRVCMVTGAASGIALFLASDECSCMNGANLMVDGGWTAA